MLPEELDEELLELPELDEPVLPEELVELALLLALVEVELPELDPLVELVDAPELPVASPPLDAELELTDDVETVAPVALAAVLLPEAMTLGSTTASQPASATAAAAANT